MAAKLNLMTQRRNGVRRRKICDKLHLFFVHGNILQTKFRTHSFTYTFFFYRQLHFRSQPESCLAILENGLETELTLPAKTCLNDSSQSELSFGTKISMRNQIF